MRLASGPSLAAILLAGHAAHAATAEAETEVIEDPLASKPATPAKAPEPAPKVRAARAVDDLRIDLWQRSTIDTHWARDALAPALGEDVLRTWLRTSFSLAGASERLRYKLDVRLDLEARAKAGLTRGAFLYDAQPLAAWVEVPIGQHVRATVGEQVVAWGRLDLASAADMLDRRDLRAGPTVDPSWSRLPIPAVRLDANVSRFDLSLVWSVLSRPHRLELSGSSWAALGPGVLSTYDARRALGRIAASTDASTFVRVQDAWVSASSAAPLADGGDLAARATTHVGGANLGLTYGYLRSKLPVIVADRALVDVLTIGTLPTAFNLVSALEEGRPLLTTTYPRYQQLAFDVEGTAGSVVLAAEVGFSPSRPMYVPDPSSLPRRADTGLFQTGARAQWNRGETFTLVFEVDYFRAVEPAHYLLLGRRGAMLASSLAARKTFDHHVLEGATVFTTSGPSLLLAARYGYELDETWTLGLGGTAFPRLRGGAGGSDGTTLADVQVGRDFVEVFVRARR